MRLAPNERGAFLFSMPWKKVKNHPDCPAKKPIGVVKSDDGELEGCHATEESANKQLAALYASESNSAGFEDLAHRSSAMDKPTHYTRAMVDISGTRARELLNDSSLPVPFIASTEGVKSDGLDLKMDEWDLSRFKEYAPVMWVHNYWHPPLGTGTARIEDSLKIDVNFDRDDDFAMKIRGKAIKGMMAGSVGWFTTMDGEDTRNTLIEFSMTPMGLDPDALPDIERMDLMAMRSQISMALGDEEAAEEILRKVLQEEREKTLTEMSTIMAALMEGAVEEMRKELEEEEPEDETGESEDVSQITTLTTGAEFLLLDGHLYAPTTLESSTTWVPLDPVQLDEFRQISIDRMSVSYPADANLEEVAERAGAVLSKKNRDDLTKALELISNVIERATPEEDDMFVTLSANGTAEEDIDVNEREQEKQSEPSLSPGVLEQINEVLASAN